MTDNIAETEEEKKEYENWLEQNKELVQEIHTFSKEEMVKYIYYKDVIISSSKKSISLCNEIILSYKEKIYSLLDKVYRLSKISNKKNKSNEINNTFTHLGTLFDSTAIKIEKAECALYKVVEKLDKKNIDLDNGRNIPNKNRAENATHNKATIEQAVSDYLDRAKRDGLSQTNQAVIDYIENKTTLKTQLKKLTKKEDKIKYTDSTFEREIKLAAAKWRKEQKQKAK